ncbi:maker284 [Drosophila busckii]|uniref:Maker284 n=1 Tax=Drosophila busckii TaxID=30019 RepID=A0A0M5JAF0_DROBS|nr:maker284 [Drosophila busckii]
MLAMCLPSHRDRPAQVGVLVDRHQVDRRHRVHHQCRHNRRLLQLAAKASIPSCNFFFCYSNLSKS